ncbi:MAG: hypothetical protein BWZ02_02216 [Lentisphaerae bacterium ADurb.BinA184]|nr:MAG: hypothetical protein BWZ02_02216 [Lentisphaerae bacterium ADurb.BinA184]
MMAAALTAGGADWETNACVERILTDGGRVRAVVVNGREIGARAVVSNGSLPRTVHGLVGDGAFGRDFLDGFDREVRLSNSSCQVYIGIKPGERLEPMGDLIFSSTCPEYDADAIAAPHVTSRTYSVYYPSIRPGTDQYTIVASMNARGKDWDGLAPDAYRAAKRRLIEDTLDALSVHIPRIRQITDCTEAATPRTFARYTGHPGGASFGTKFEALKYSMGLPAQVGGLFHTGSTGIIMSGWLGSMNYGIITANQAEKYLEGPPV